MQHKRRVTQRIWKGDLSDLEWTYSRLGLIEQRYAANSAQHNRPQYKTISCNAIQTILQWYDKYAQCSAVSCQALSYNTVQKIQSSESAAQHRTSQHNTGQDNTTQYSVTVIVPNIRQWQMNQELNVLPKIIQHWYVFILFINEIVLYVKLKSWFIIVRHFTRHFLEAE